MGEKKVRKTKLNQKLVNELIDLGKSMKGVSGIENVASGKTLCAHDFYEGFLIRKILF